MTLQLSDKQQSLLARIIARELLTLEEVAFIEGRQYTDTEVVRNLESIHECLTLNLQ